MYSTHYVKERIAREKLIAEIGIGEAVATIKLDRGHPAGAELHTITTTGIIVIRNVHSGKIVTKLIARPGQVRRYFDEIAPEVEKIIQIARIHQQLMYNEM